MAHFRPEGIYKNKKSREVWKTRREKKNTVNMGIKLALGDQLSMGKKKKPGVTRRF